MSELGKENTMIKQNYITIVKGLDKGLDLFESNFKKLRDLMVKDSKFFADKKYNLSNKFKDWNKDTLALVKSWNVSPKNFDTVSRAYRASTKLDKNGKLNKAGMKLGEKSISNLGLKDSAEKSGYEAPKKAKSNPAKNKELSNAEMLSLIGVFYSKLTVAKYRPTEDRLEYLRDKRKGYDIAIQDIPQRKTAIPGK